MGRLVSASRCCVVRATCGAHALMHSVDACWRDDVVLLVTRNWHFLVDFWLFPVSRVRNSPRWIIVKVVALPDWHPGILGSVAAYLFV